MSGTKKPAKQADRRQRLAAQLRANLARRKGQAAARKQDRDEPKDKGPASR